MAPSNRSSLGKKGDAAQQEGLRALTKKSSVLKLADSRRSLGRVSLGRTDVEAVIATRGGAAVVTKGPKLTRKMTLAKGLAVTGTGTRDPRTKFVPKPQYDFDDPRK
jgi:hypothetical protein